jgi:signal transduction histidine kinase
MHSIAPQKALPSPELTQGSQQPLGIHSTLSDLPRYAFTVESDYAIQDLIARFVQFPDLPGVIIADSVLSRQQFLECLLYLGQTADFTRGSIRLLLNQANRRALTLPALTPILQGAQQALKRPLEHQSEPIVVQQPQGLYLLDAHSLNVAHWQIRGIETQIRYERLQMQLLQSEKMAALGRLVDGVAHEILDPVSFIWGNLSYIDNYAQQQSQLLLAYEAALNNPPPEILQLREDIELDYLRSDLPAAIKSARGGAHRLRQLATGLQNFCHIDEVHPRPTDLNSLIDGTLRLLKSRLTTPINIERCYGKLPPVPCFSGQLSQVFMNLFTNAINSLLAQAQLEDYTPGDPHPLLDKAPEITVTTCTLAAEDTPTVNPHEARWVSIIISDNGPGLLPETKAQIIDSFSTERRSRKETGLAMSYQIVTAKHGGRLWLRSFHASEELAASSKHPSTGTEFEILLPLTLSEVERDAELSNHR